MSAHSISDAPSLTGHFEPRWEAVAHSRPVSNITLGRVTDSAHLPRVKRVRHRNPTVVMTGGWWIVQTGSGASSLLVRLQAPGV